VRRWPMSISSSFLARRSAAFFMLSFGVASGG
jgi:hypothetical protein